MLRHWFFQPCFASETIKPIVMTVERGDCIYFGLIFYEYQLNVKNGYFSRMLTDSSKRNILMEFHVQVMQ